MCRFIIHRAICQAQYVPAGGMLESDAIHSQGFALQVYGGLGSVAQVVYSRKFFEGLSYSWVGPWDI